MSQLAGYDMMFQISNEALCHYLQEHVKIGGISLQTPSELDQGGLYARFTSLRLEFPADDQVSLVLDFENASYAGFGDLAGSFTVTAALGQSAERRPVLDLTNATGSLTPAALQAVLGGTIDDEIIPALRAHGQIEVLPLTMTVDPGSNGHLFTGSLCSTITPAFQVVSVVAHTIRNTDIKKQALAFCAILLLDRAGGGDDSDVEFGIPDGSNVSLSLSATAFERLLFCPATHCIDPQHPGDVPGPCGQGKGVTVNGVTITELSETFEHGQIRIHASANTGGFGYTADGSAEAILKLSVVEHQLQATLDVPTVDFDVHLDAKGWALAFFTGGLIGVGAAGYLDGTTQSVTIGVAAIQAALARGLPTLDPETTGLALDAVAVTPEGLTLSGSVDTARHPPQPRFLVSGSVTTAQAKVVNSGTATLTARCIAGSYPFEEYAQSQIGTYEAIATLFFHPLKIAWSLRGGSTIVPVPGGEGTLEIPAMETGFPFPLQGGTRVTRTVEIDYRVGQDGRLLEIRNRPDQGNFSLAVICELTDGRRNAAIGEALATFEGDRVVLGGDWNDRVARCAREMRNRIRALGVSHHYSAVKPWVPVDHPRPEDLRSFIDPLTALRSPEATELLGLTRLAHGITFEQATMASAVPALVNIDLSRIGGKYGH